MLPSPVSGWNGDGDDVWTDGRKNKMGVWQWSTGKVIDNGWAPYEPSGNGDCTQLYRVKSKADYSFGLDDKECSSVNEYVCEKQP